jgi:hypothetical protein
MRAISARIAAARAQRMRGIVLEDNQKWIAMVKHLHYSWRQ